MKVVHIIRKNLELEAAYKEIGAERAKLEMKRYLKLKAKKQVKMNLTKSTV